MPLYVFTVEDGGGDSQFVGFCLVGSENTQAVSAMLQGFVDCNPNTTEYKMHHDR